MKEKHWFGTSSSSSKRQGHPIMYGAPQPVHMFDSFPDGGGYPKRFLEWAYREMRVDDPRCVLHLCSGSVRHGYTIDARESVQPLIVADVRHLPIRSESFQWILADPPYAADYAKNLYHTEAVYPTPGEILKECARVCVTGGLIGLLHFIVPMTRKPLKIKRVFGITTGNGSAIRAWTLPEKVDPESVRWRNGT